jgi:hypothetical protein
VRRQPAKSIYRHNLAGILETAIRASNAQFDKADVLTRLDVSTYCSAMPGPRPHTSLAPSPKPFLARTPTHKHRKGAQRWKRVVLACLP